MNLPNPFLNDVAIGPDGAAYFTNSNTSHIIQVAQNRGRWQAKLWADSTGVIEQQPGFNLGGIVVSPDRQALVAAQGNVGKLWRFSLRSAKVSKVDTRGADLVDADGLILWGHLLIVVRNFSKRLSTLRLDDRARTARQLKDVPTDPDRSSPPPRSPEADCSWSTASSTSRRPSRRIRSSPSH